MYGAEKHRARCSSEMMKFAVCKPEQDSEGKHYQTFTLASFSGEKDNILLLFFLDDHGTSLLSREVVQEINVLIPRLFSITTE